MQQYPLLQTKLYIPPIRPELVSRPRLLGLLNAGLNRKLTLISAPAGFGKTTLVSEWLVGCGRPAAWLSLDEGDNDPTRFLTYLVAALRTLSPSPAEGTGVNLGKGILSALQSPQPPPIEAALISLINEIATLPGSMILVLDDHHTIASSAVDDALAFLLEHLPPQMYLVIATREDPHLPLARLRARGQLTELRASDLRFTTSEAAKFLNQMMGLDLSAENIAALERRTEGWIAGLQLAALALRGTLAIRERDDATSLIGSFTGSHRYVLDYLIEEVIEQQSQDVQTFLQQTSVLDRLTGPLCDAVTGQDNSQATLEMLDRANLFIIQLDEERRWYRYHHLFADLLLQRLRQTQPEQLPILHLRASEWYEQNGFTDEAIEHALRSQNFELAVSLIENVVDVMWGRDKHNMLQRWLDELPIELVFTKPHLCIFLARQLFASGQQDAAERALQAAEQVLGPNSDLSTQPALSIQDRVAWMDRRKLLARIAATRSTMASYRSDAFGILPHAHQALMDLSEQDTFWRGSATIALGDAYVFQGQYTEAHRTYLEASELIKSLGNPYLSLNVSNRLALALRSQGRLQQVLELCPQQLEFASRSNISQTEPVGWLLAIWGETLAEVDDLDGALHQAKTGIELVKRGRDVAMLTWSYMCLTRVLFSLGDMAGAQELVTESAKISRESIVPAWVTNMMAAWRVRIWLAQGRLDATLQWVENRELHPDAHPTYVGALLDMALARVLVAREQYQDAIGLLERLQELAETGGHVSRATESLTLQALAFQAQGDTTQAVGRLDRALALAKPGGFIRTFVDEGPSMARLLYEAAARGIAPDYARRLLAAFPVAEPEKADPAKAQAPKSEIVEPLSEREIEVLQLIAGGLTNPEIASRLFLSLNTVKAHNRNIYGKLNVHSRTQAIVRAQALGLLPPK